MASCGWLILSHMISMSGIETLVAEFSLTEKILATDMKRINSLCYLLKIHLFDMYIFKSRVSFALQGKF